MDNKNNSNGVFDQIKKKTNVSEQSIKSLANKINPNDLQDEKKIRALIAQISAMAGVPVSKEKENKIVSYFISNKLNPNDMQSMIKMFTQQPKK
jgi:hypothetical protein